jgi:excisionase family DNA binding protein
MLTSTRFPLLTVDEVARRLKLHRATIYRYLGQGLPHVRLGGGHGAVRIDEAELRAWLAAQHSDRGPA